MSNFSRSTCALDIGQGVKTFLKLGISHIVSNVTCFENVVFAYNNISVHKIVINDFQNWL